MTTTDATLQTARLTVRPMRPSDAPAFARLGADDVFAMVPEVEVPFDAHAWVAHKLKWEEPTICHTVLLSEAGRTVGFCQVPVVAGEHDYELSVGYWYGREHWGQGYATEALMAVLDHLHRKARGRLRPAYAEVHPENAASIRVLEKCSFVLAGRAHDAGHGFLRYRWLGLANRSAA